MRRPQLHTAIVFAIQSLVLSLALMFVSVSRAHADDTTLVANPHVRAATAGRVALAPGAPANSGGDQTPLPTPVKPPRAPRVPPVWNLFAGPGLAGNLVQLWIGMQGTGQVLASRVHAQ